ncbi:hypothetical protein KC351_g92 [Hortaea werneckii]|nr:hypothetical protein KC351_g92 [Hortaea werneckii]
MTIEDTEVKHLRVATLTLCRLPLHLATRTPAQADWPAFGERGNFNRACLVRVLILRSAASAHASSEMVFGISDGNSNNSRIATARVLGELGCAA